MSVLAAVLTTSILAMGPQWAIIDLPYPEVTGAESAPAMDVRLAEAITNYAKAKSGKPLNSRPEMAPLRVGADSASVRVKIGDRSEIVILNRVRNEWRVVEALTEAHEY